MEIRSKIDPRKVHFFLMEYEVDGLFIRYFKNKDNTSKIYIDDTEVAVVFFNEYIALRDKELSKYPSIIIKPLIPEVLKDYPVYVNPIVFQEEITATDSNFYSFEAAVWKSYSYQVDAVSNDYQIARRLHTLLEHKVFPKVFSTRYFKVSENNFRLIEITNIAPIETETDSTFHSSFTYTIKLPVYERDPVVDSNVKTVNFTVQKVDYLDVAELRKNILF
jgi:hypothetical protein